MNSQRYLALIALAMAAAALAGTGGGVAGAVVDPSGGVMPDVVVSARNIDTGVTQKTSTNGDGFYAFPALGRSLLTTSPMTTGWTTPIRRGKAERTSPASTRFPSGAHNSRRSGLRARWFCGPAAVNGNITSASFGQIVNAAAPRLIQLAVKFSF